MSQYTLLRIDTGYSKTNAPWEDCGGGLTNHCGGSWLLRWVCGEHESTDDSTSVSNTSFKFIVKFRQNGIPLSWRLWQNPQMLCVIMSNEDTNSSCGLPRISSFPAAWCKFGSLSGSISKNISLVDHFSPLFVCRRQTRKNKSSNTVQDQDTCKNKTRLKARTNGWRTPQCCAVSRRYG